MVSGLPVLDFLVELTASSIVAACLSVSSSDLPNSGISLSDFTGSCKALFRSRDDLQVFNVGVSEITTFSSCRRNQRHYPLYQLR